MDAAETATVRQRLLADERQSIEQIAVLNERSREVQSPDEVAFSSEASRADEAPLAVEREKELALLQALHRHVHDVQHALAKIEQGIYDRCDACGGPISPQRLRAQPHAALCINCQAKAEGSR